MASLEPDHAPADGVVDLAAAIEARRQASVPEERRVRRLARLGVGLGAGVLVVGAAVSAAWFLGLALVTTVLPGLASMKLSTSASLVGLGAALLLLSRRPPSSRARVALLLLALAGSGLALVTLAGYVAGAGWGSLDALLVLGTRGSAAGGDGRMAQATAVMLLLVWLALAAAALDRHRPAQGLAALALTLGAITTLGYVYDVRSLYAVGPFSTTALHTALATVAASSSLLCLRSDVGFVSLLTGNTAGGVIVRRLMPVALLVPMLLGVLVVRGEAADLYDGPLGLALLAAGVALTGGVLTWWQAAQLRHIDIRRAGAEEALAVAQQAIEARERMALDLLAAERRQRMVIETSAEAYLALDLEGRLTDWNDAAARLFGWERAEVLGQDAVELLIPPGDRDQGQAELAALRDGHASRLLDGRRELPMRDRHGASRLVEVVFWGVDGPGQGDRSLHGFLADVTERRAMEAELRRSHSDLRDFSTAMAHDLNTPLSVIRGATHVLREILAADPGLAGTELGTTGTGLLERIDRAAGHGCSLIADILTFARLRDHAPESAEVDLTRLVGDVAEEELAAAERAATIEVGRCGIVLADQGLLRQLFSNLLANALKYVPADRRPEVVVTAERDAGTRGVRLAVTDNGDGIATADRERIFAMFERGAATSGMGGTGVGLAISQRVSELHHGHIAVAAGPHGGARFEILLGTASIEPPDPGAPRIVHRARAVPS